MVLLSRSSMGWHHTTRVSCQGGKVWWRASSSKVGCVCLACHSPCSRSVKKGTCNLGAAYLCETEVHNCDFQNLASNFWQ